jgi:hypothetical protein
LRGEQPCRIARFARGGGDLDCIGPVLLQTSNHRQHRGRAFEIMERDDQKGLLLQIDQSMRMLLHHLDLYVRCFRTGLHCTPKNRDLVLESSFEIAVELLVPACCKNGDFRVALEHTANHIASRSWIC